MCVSTRCCGSAGHLKRLVVLSGVEVAAPHSLTPSNIPTKKNDQLRGLVGTKQCVYLCRFADAVGLRLGAWCGRLLMFNHFFQLELICQGAHGTHKFDFRLFVIVCMHIQGFTGRQLMQYILWGDVFNDVKVFVLQNWDSLCRPYVQTMIAY